MKQYKNILKRLLIQLNTEHLSGQNYVKNMQRKYIPALLVVLLIIIVFIVNTPVRQTLISTEGENFSEFDLLLKELKVKEVPSYILFDDRQVQVRSYKNNSVYTTALTEEQFDRLQNSELRVVRTSKPIKFKDLKGPVALEVFMATCPDCKSLTSKELQETRKFFKDKDYVWYRYYIKSTRKDVLKF